MTDAWTRRIARADELASRDTAAGSLLRVYARLLRLQCDSYTTLSEPTRGLSGDLARDLPRVRPCAVRMLHALDTIVPPHIATEAAQLLAGGDAAIDAALIGGWQNAQGDFFAKLALQPYAECLAQMEMRPIARDPQAEGARCPFCAGAPQVSVLHGESTSDGGGRSLQCATCATTWPFRRVVCARCGTEDERQLGYFQAPEFDHVRVDVCDGCGHYLKTIDLTRLGHAVPLVDDVASGSLDLWAVNQGYRRIEPNLVGL